MNQLKLYPDTDTMPSLYTAVLKPTGEVWDFSQMEWASGPPRSHHFTSNPDVTQASWGKDDSDVEVREYRLTLCKVYKERRK